MQALQRTRKEEDVKIVSRSSHDSSGSNKTVRWSWVHVVGPTLPFSGRVTGEQGRGRHYWILEAAPRKYHSSAASMWEISLLHRTRCDGDSGIRSVQLTSTEV